MWLIACGLKREVAIIARKNVIVIAGGGQAAPLEAALEAHMGTACAVLSCGVGGALIPDLMAGDLCVGPLPGCDDNGLAIGIHAHIPHARMGQVSGQDSLLATAKGKMDLHARTGADLVDMESHVAARVAARHGVPGAFIRAISDDSRHDLPPAMLVGMAPDGGIAGPAIARSLLTRPGQIAALWRAGRDVEQGFRALTNAFDLLGRAGIFSRDLGQFAFHMG